MEMNVKKGANAFVLSISMILLGAIAHGIYFVASLFFENENFFALFVFMSKYGNMILIIGSIWLLFSLVGSFFTFNTERWIMKAFVAGALSGFTAFVFLFFVIISRTNILKHPWMIITFEVLAGLMFLLLSSTFFFHAARPADSKPDRMEKFVLAAMKVLPSKYEYH